MSSFEDYTFSVLTQIENEQQKKSLVIKKTKNKFAKNNLNLKRNII